MKKYLVVSQGSDYGYNVDTFEATNQQELFRKILKFNETWVSFLTGKQLDELMETIEIDKFITLVGTHSQYYIETIIEISDVLHGGYIIEDKEKKQ